MRSGRAAMFLCVCWGYAVDVSPARAQPDTPELRVRLHAEVGLDIPWLPLAQAMTEGIFRDVGMRLSWIGCGAADVDTACDRAPDANEFVVRILRRRLDPASYGCGVSLRPDAGMGHYITLFHDCIRAASDDLRVGEPVLAAYSVAHEIGHLLLPVGHASRGIMRARPDRFDWQRAARGALRFLPSEVAQMRQALRRRLASSS